MKMGKSNIIVIQAIIFLVATTFLVSEAKTIVVGGDHHWKVAFNYSHWAFQNNPFYINDNLVFKYDPPSENSSAVDVYRLPDLYSYVTCDFRRAKLVADATQGGGEGFTVGLNQWRPYYFASGQANGTFCKHGMKFFAVPWPHWFL